MAEKTKLTSLRLSDRCAYQLDQIQLKKNYKNRTETLHRIIEMEFIKLFPNKADITEHTFRDLIIDPEFRLACANYGYQIIIGKAEK